MSCCLIKQFNDVLDEEKLNKIKHFCSEADSNAQIGGGSGSTVDTKIRNALVSNVSDNDFSYSNMYASILWEKSKEYLKSFGKRLFFDEDHFESVFKIEPISFLKYKPGYFYKIHSDEAFLGPCQPDFVRELSYVFFVNEDFSGGGLSFPNQKKIIKPKANTLIIFPSNWCFPHEVLPVTRGIRYSAVTWGGRIA
jgi:predicted 2-oxoglutarate/Fe(II)-dependent dioxygenase YbiX